MSGIAEIESAIKKLAAPQVDELAGWLERHRVRRATPPPVESWLQRARGAARPGQTTAKVMCLGVALSGAFRIFHSGRRTWQV